MNPNLIETRRKHPHLHSITALAFAFGSAGRLKRPAADSPPIPKENVMRGRVMTILASAVLAGSLLATDAQARGGGGGGGGHGGGFGGGHMGGGFGGDHMGGFGGGMGGFGAGRVGGFGAGRIAHVDHDRFGGARHRFAGGGNYDYGLGCPYYPYYTHNYPYYCDY
jgi:hypothetical protein